jgi:hypothetical protein
MRRTISAASLGRGAATADPARAMRGRRATLKNMAIVSKGYGVAEDDLSFIVDIDDLILVVPTFAG